MQTRFNTIVVIGLGYIGLPTAAAFAARKKNVIGVDINCEIVETINQGKIHIVEPELDMLVHAAVKEGYLKATTESEPADAFFIAVPTPFKGENHEPDLSYIQAAAESIAPHLKRGNLVILESTSPVGTTESLAQWLADARSDLTFPHIAGENSDIRIAHCPERVLPGHIMRELVENDRLIGGITQQCSQAATALYKTFVAGECVTTNSRTAEMAKLAENSFRDVNIAFANELSTICDQLNINVWELIRLANRHPRVNILQPGPGVGGHCIAVDPWFIVSKSPDQAKLIRTARQVNDEKPAWVVEKVKSACFLLTTERDIKLSSISVACLGLTFKADIDDLRGSPALEIAMQLNNDLPGSVTVCEPNIEFLPDSLTGLKLVSEEEAFNADVLVLLVDHKEFRMLNSSSLEYKYVVDIRGIWPQLKSF